MYCDKPELRAFLLLLEKDLPDQYACLNCHRLHLHHPAVTRTTGLRQFYKSRGLRVRECRLLDRAGESMLFLNQKIGFEDLHAAMEEHLTNGSADVHLARLSATRSISRPLPGLWLSQEFQITDREMLLCTVHRVESQEHWRDLSELPIRISICPHFRTTSSRNDTLALRSNTSTGFIRHDVSSLHELFRSANHNRLYTCSDCYTEFEASCERDEQGRYKTTFTSWKNLGNCKSPFTAQYRSHVSAHSGEWENGKWVSAVQWTPGSIKAAWEGGKRG